MQEREKRERERKTETDGQGPRASEWKREEGVGLIGLAGLGRACRKRKWAEEIQPKRDFRNFSDLIISEIELNKFSF